MPVQLVIKAPNQKVADYLIECELDWDVLRLKNHLSEVYPTNPQPDEQRLIYAGRLIKDHLSLKDFINYEEGQKYILHLVCSQHSVSSPDQTDNPPPRDLNVPNSSSPPTSHLRQRVPLSSLNDDSPSSGGDGTSSSPHSPPGENHLPGMPFPGMASPELMAQQMAAMQHFYAQYMAQFVQQAQLAGFPVAYPDFTSAAAVSPSNSPGTPPIGAPAENMAPADVNRAQVVANPNVRMNAQGGPLLDDEEDDVGNRDWLDWFYIFSRAVVLFSILFFYSSLGRFMVVTGVAILIYMYQGGWFGGRVPLQAPAAVPQQPQQQQAGPGRDEQENVANDPFENEQGQENEQPANQDPVSSPDVQRENSNEEQDEIQNVMDLMDGNREPNHHGSEPNLIQTLWLFLTSFFVSLIPDQPPPVNVN